MTREDFKKIIALRSIWTVGRGDFELPDGKYLHLYIRRLICGQLAVDDYMIGKDGNLHVICGYGKLSIAPGICENYSFEEEQERIETLINEIMNESQPVKGKELGII